MPGAMTVRVSFRISRRMYEDLAQQAKAWDLSVSDMVRRCVARSVYAPDAYEYREISLGRNGFQPERAMEYLAARRPLVSDLSSGDHLDVSLRRVLRQNLPELQARRLEQRLRGKTYDQIGVDEGCSKQAAEQAVSRALDALKNNIEFIEAISAMFPKSGLDARTVLQATIQEVSYVR